MKKVVQIFLFSPLDKAGQYKELEDAIFWGNKNGGNKASVRLEALQVAAMSTRLLMMLTPSPVTPIPLFDAEEEVD